MTWGIHLPVRSRDDPVTQLGSDARYLETAEDAAVVRRLALDAIGRHETVGQFLDELEHLDTAGRRRLLDGARKQCGLEASIAIDHAREQRAIDRRFEQFDIPGPPRWSEWQGCPAKGCNVRPTEPSGALRPVLVNQWWCERHKHMARPGDLEEHEPPYVGFSDTGRPIPSEKEKARIREEVERRDAPRRREQEKRQAHREAEADALDEVERRYREQTTCSIGGVRVRLSDGAIVS